MNAARPDPDSVPLSDREAVAAITARLRSRAEGEDDEWWARELLAALKGLGYRKVIDLDVADWRRPKPEADAVAGAYARGGELWRTALAERGTGPMPALREETETITEGKEP